jgi:hypothetical protein
MKTLLILPRRLAEDAVKKNVNRLFRHPPKISARSFEATADDRTVQGIGQGVAGTADVDLADFTGLDASLQNVIKHALILATVH